MTNKNVHPTEQIAALMNRIYHYGLTTISGGNLSILEADGSMWITPAGLGITPAGVDKGRLRPEDVARILPDGAVEGSQRPSSEYPFHRAIYDARPDLRAVVHAHPSALISFSLVHRLPAVNLTPHAHQVCGPVGFAPYAMPSSPQLGENIAAAFADGFNVVLLENHGIVAGGPDLLTAFQRLETLEYAARVEIRARGLGDVRSLSDARLELAGSPQVALPEFDPPAPETPERELRQQIADMVRRGCDHQLMIAAQGVISARLGDDSCLITPTGQDRPGLTAEDIVLVSDGRREAGKNPSRAAQLHRAIYRHNPDVRSIVSSQPVHAMAYAVSSARFDTRTIPESYILLVDVPVLPFEMPYRDPDAVAERVSLQHPVCLVENECALAVGRSVLQAFDRLEVLENSARALIETRALGQLVPIAQSDIDRLDEVFLPRL